jgi:bifunctional non-homologous end joining protein LigD
MTDHLVATDPASARTWRPQAIGSGKVRDIDDPLIEPLWSGRRVLAHVGGGTATLVDETGAEQVEDVIAAALVESVAALDAILDGYLTTDPARSGEGVVLASGVEAPSALQMTRQLLIGGNPDRDARVDALRGGEPEPQPLGEHLVFVAVDLLALDGDALLDVPLLERKRLLDAVVGEAELVRLGIHVRPPIDPWLATWRALGFRSLVYKAANSRYRPGQPNDAWAVVAIPTR